MAKQGLQIVIATCNHAHALCCSCFNELTCGDRHSSEGDMGGGGDLNSATPQKKLRITARKVHETPSPQQLFLAT